MRLLIDGYNLMWTLELLNPIARKDFNLARELLEKMIIAYSGYVDDDIFLVLDGYRGTCPYTQRVTKKGIEVVVTGRGMNADMWIVDTMAIVDFEGTVVTSDRQIINSAERRNVPVIKSGSFETILMETIGGEPELLKSIEKAKRDCNLKGRTRRHK